MGPKKNTDRVWGEPKTYFVWNDRKHLAILDVWPESFFKFAWSIKNFETSRYIEHSNLTELDGEFYRRWAEAGFKITDDVKTTITEAMNHK